MSEFEHGYPFDPAYGRSLDELLDIPAPAPPVGFDAYWRDRFAAAAGVATAPAVGPQEDERDGSRIFGLSYTSVGGLRLGGWLVLPAAGPVEHGFVIGHGYGGRQEPGADVPLPLPRSAAILPCVRGMGSRSRRPGIPGEAGEHVLHGIESRETYVIGDCVADLWCAASALLELVPELKTGPGSGPGEGARLGYVGESLGGGLGALALPWDDRFDCGQLTVPTFGNHPLRVTLPSVGSGEAVRVYSDRHPEVMDVLAYFDAATAAKRIGVPMLVAPALFDPAVPPPGQFAVYNALPEPRELHLLRAGHFEYVDERGDVAALVKARRGFFAARLG
ncbi:deacetylase [Streptomyces camponoticapitis]|uniref:Deacetylase n=1 Tax=Streptomyces camponoticapitis TaxID=1616125 RepID=A0ABQ2ENQ7_9ACTN|nr:acetylxylan esterase [Streptomyces camponoticapitis]GGK14718.1 deacetylase [Streptomyces camponoticapitis]